MSDVSPQNVQELYQLILDKKAEAKKLRDFLKDQYFTIPGFEGLENERLSVVTKMRQIKENVKAANPKEAGELSDLGVELKALHDQLSFVLLAKYSKNESVELKDKFGQMCLPIFTVKLEKAK